MAFGWRSFSFLRSIAMKAWAPKPSGAGLLAHGYRINRWR
jgi:hypothetical protein